MTHPAKPTETPQPPSATPSTPRAGRVEEPMVCWTQLLREVEPEFVGPVLPLGPMPSWADMERLFAQLEEDPLDNGQSSS